MGYSIPAHTEKEFCLCPRKNFMVSCSSGVFYIMELVVFNVSSKPAKICVCSQHCAQSLSTCDVVIRSVRGDKNCQFCRERYQCLGHEHVNPLPLDLGFLLLGITLLFN